MTFIDPLRLFLLVVPIALAIVYLVVQMRRPTYSVRFATTDLLASVAPKRPGWRRHIPAIATLVALALFVIAFANPATQRNVSRERSTVILAIDISASMQATDVDPSRIAAAKVAASSFVRTAPENVQIGIVHFAGNAVAAQAPTFERAPLERTIQNLELGSGTAIGEAIFASLDVLKAAEVITPDKPSDTKRPPARIVVMSDGYTNQGRSNESAAEAASEAGIPVTTIAFGTEDGSIINPQNGQRQGVPVDGAALQEIADQTGGEYFEAASSDALRKIYQNIGKQVGVEKKNVNIAAWFVGFGLLFAFLAAVLSLLWFQRLP